MISDTSSIGTQEGSRSNASQPLLSDTRGIEEPAIFHSSDNISTENDTCVSSLASSQCACSPQDIHNLSLSSLSFTGSVS